MKLVIDLSDYFNNEESNENGLALIPFEKILGDGDIIVNFTEPEQDEVFVAKGVSKAISFIKLLNPDRKSYFFSSLELSGEYNKTLLLESNEGNITIDVLTINNLKLGKFPENFIIKDFTYKGHILDYLNFPFIERSLTIDLTPYKAIQEVKNKLGGVVILPGSGEFVYDTTQNDFFLAYHNQSLNNRWFKDYQAIKDNTNSKTNSLLSIKQLKETLPNVKWASVTISWYCDDEDLSKASVKPGVEWRFDKHHKHWQVGEFNRANAYLVSRDKIVESVSGFNNGYPFLSWYETEKPINGGTDSDESILSYIKALKEEGYLVALYPLMLVDTKGKPWRGHLNGNNDEQVIHNFFTTQYGYNNFIKHYANLAKDYIDAFLIGSEMKGLTAVMGKDKSFPAVEELINLAKNTRQILGSKVKQGYAADWSEYHHADKGWRPLDRLFASEFIDFVGIDAYFPITDKKYSNITEEDIRKGWQSGETYDYYLNGDTKCPLSADWALKNIKHWWETEHFNPDGHKTEWQPKMKKIWFTEFGFPSIDRSTNQPNVFYDPECSDGGAPKYSNTNIDYHIQWKAIAATLEIIEGFEFLENAFLWCWDARPYPAFPNSSYWSDGASKWSRGHWIIGKTEQFGIVKINENLNIPFITINAQSLEIYNDNITGQEFSATLTKGVSINTKYFKNSISLKSESLEVNNENIIGEEFLAIISKSIKINTKCLNAKQAILDGGSLAINPANFIVNKLILRSNSFIDIIHTQINSSNSWTEGSKYSATEHRTNFLYSTFKTDILKISFQTLFRAYSAQFTSEIAFIEGKDCFLESGINSYRKNEYFEGKENLLTRASNSWLKETHEESIQLLSFVIKELKIDITGDLSLKGAMFVVDKFESAVNNYKLEPIYLKHSISNESKTRKHGGFGGFKHGRGRSGGSEVNSAVIMVHDKGYAFANNELYLLGSQMIGGLTIDANKITLEAAIGNDFHGFKVTKVGQRLLFKCGEGELSLGAETFHNMHSEFHFQEWAALAGLYGVESINANNIRLKGAQIVNRDGPTNIKAKEIEFDTQIIKGTHIIKNYNTTAGARVGVQESASRIFRGIENLARTLNNLQLSPEALNALSQIRSTYVNFAQAAENGFLRGGGWVQGEHREEILTTETTRPVFNTLNFTDLHAEVDEISGRGVNMEGVNYNIKTKKMNLEPAEETFSYTSDSNYINGQIGLTGNIGTNLNMGARETELEVRVRHPNIMNLAGNFTLQGEELSGSLTGNAQNIDLNLQRLSLESVQDETQFSSQSFNMGFGIGSNNAPSLNNIGGEHSRGYSLITNRQVHLHATNNATINASEYLRLDGARVSADNTTSVNTAQLITTEKQDINNSSTFGLGFNIASPGSMVGTETTVKVGVTDQQRFIESGFSEGAEITENGVRLSQEEIQRRGLNNPNSNPEFEGTKIQLDVSYASVDHARAQEAFRNAPSKIVESVQQAANDVLDCFLRASQLILDTKNPDIEVFEDNVVIIDNADTSSVDNISLIDEQKVTYQNEPETNDEKKYAKFCKMSYYVTFKDIVDKAKKQGYEVIYKLGNSNKFGYFGFAMHNKATNEIIIVHRGTETQFMSKNLARVHKDFIDDFRIAFEKLPLQLKKAESLTKSILEKYPNSKITQIGHSLGGVYAELLAVKYNQLAYSYDSPGTKPLVAKFAPGITVQPDRIKIIKSLPNIINTCGESLHNSVTQINVPINDKNISFSKYHSYDTIISLHSIENINKSFENKTLRSSWPNNFASGYFEFRFGPNPTEEQKRQCMQELEENIENLRPQF